MSSCGQTLIYVRGWADSRTRQSLKRILHTEFSGGRVGLGLHAFTAEGAGTTPGWGTKIPQDMRHSPPPPPQKKFCYQHMQNKAYLG